jgi:1,2-phenylacetyl-CoA epoxidase catalytic subunit
MAGMAQDELGQTRAIFNFIEQTYDLPENQIEFGRSADKIHSMQLLDEAPQNWADFIVTLYLTEQAQWSALEGYVGGEYVPVSNFCKKFAEEGYFHRLYVDGWLAALTDEEKKDAAKAFVKRLPLARQWFNFGDETVHEAGIRPWSAADCLTHFEEGIKALAKAIGIDIPAVGGNVKAWDAIRRRPEGSTMPARLWEYVLPTSDAATMARRPLSESVKDNIDLFGKPKKVDKTEPFFEQ